MTRNSPATPSGPSCETFRHELQDLWYGGEWSRRGAGAQLPVSAPDLVLERRRDLPAPVRHHLETCPACKDEVAALLELEARLEETFQAMGKRGALPSGERVEAILARLATARASRAGSRRRRALRTLLWFLFLLSTFLGFAALVALALRALR